jgi:hypothetical protein
MAVMRLGLSAIKDVADLDILGFDDVKLAIIKMIAGRTLEHVQTIEDKYGRTGEGPVVSAESTAEGEGGGSAADVQAGPSSGAAAEGGTRGSGNITDAENILGYARFGKGREA